MKTITEKLGRVIKPLEPATAIDNSVAAYLLKSAGAIFMPMAMFILFAICGQLLR